MAPCIKDMKLRVLKVNDYKEPLASYPFSYGCVDEFYLKHSKHQQ